MTYNPVDEINRYNAITQRRGYPYFSDQSVQDFYKKYDYKKPMREIHKEADAKADQFLNAARDINAYDHMRARQRYREEFQGNEQRVRDYFKQEAYDRYGVGKLPVKNEAYERRVLTPKGAIKTADQSAEMEVFKMLMRAKWEAVGYEGDGDVIENFQNHYALALQL